VAAALLLAVVLGLVLPRPGRTSSGQPGPVIAIARSQDSSTESPGTWVERFVAGDDGASAKIRSLGPGTLELLRPHRKSPRVRDLIRLVRESAATSEDRLLGERLAGLPVKGQGSRMTLYDALVEMLGNQVHFGIDPRGNQELGASEVTIPKEGSSLDVLEDICAEAGADFAFLYGVVLVARPEHLWPPLPLEERPLTEAQKVRARTLVEQLGSERPELRDRASAELLRLGRSVIPVLETGAANVDPEVAGRCRGLTKELSRKPGSVFAAPAAERQGSESSLVPSFKGKLITYKVKDLPLKNAFALLFSQNTTLWTGKVPDVKCTFAFENAPFWAVLAMMTQCCGLDFVIENDRVILGPQQEILERLPK
jgi:hypothetical protein